MSVVEEISARKTPKPRLQSWLYTHVILLLP
jgi:hypothetical protein